MVRAKKAFEALKLKMSSAPILKHLDPELPAEVILYANAWAIGATLAQRHDNVLHPVRFTGRVLKDAELNYHDAEKEVLALLRVLKDFFYVLRGRSIRVYTRYSTMRWLYTSKSVTGRALQFAVMLSPWKLEIHQMKKDEWAFTGLLATSILSPEEMDQSLEELFPDKVNKTRSCVPNVRLERGYTGLLLSSDGSAKPPDKGAYGSYGFIVWELPSWSVVHAENHFMENTTVNEAEYRGVLAGLNWLAERGFGRAVVVGDSRIAIQQLNGIIKCHKPNLQVLLSQAQQLAEKMVDVKFAHVLRLYNQSADHLATDALTQKASRVVSTLEEKEVLRSLNKLPEVIYQPDEKEMLTSAESLIVADESIQLDVDPTEVAMVATGLTEVLEAQDERWRRIAQAQDEEVRWKHLKQYLTGELETLSQEQCDECMKRADMFELSADGILYYAGPLSQRRKQQRSNRATQAEGESTPSSAETLVGQPTRVDHQLRLVVPTTLVMDVLSVAHSELSGGHQGITRTYLRLKQEYYWPGMFSDVERYVNECMDCVTARGRPNHRGHSPGNILPNGPFRCVSMDFVIPLPKSFRGNTALLLFQCMFSGYVICKTMSKTTAEDCAEAFMEVVYQRFGACEILRHDQDPRFMSDVFKAFNRMLRQRQKATLSYRPQANGQQERSVQTVIQTVKLYIEDSQQRDWDDLAEKLMFALNTAYDFSRKETPFYLVHGWDARNTVSAMIPSRPGRGVDLASPADWRRMVRREHEYAMKTAWHLQKELKEKRAQLNNEQREERDDEMEPGDSVWLYIKNVKPGLTKKLAHLWHGPFRISKKTNQYSVELELPDREGYRFYPTVHISRLKLRRCYPTRPEVELAVDARLDFDEELLSEDSWEMDEDEYEVERIMDCRFTRRSRAGRRFKEYLIKWKGYVKLDWVSERNLSCGALIYEFEQVQRQHRRLQAMQVSDEVSSM